MRNAVLVLILFGALLFAGCILPIQSEQQAPQQQSIGPETPAGRALSRLEMQKTQDGR